jgi:hypothetical protein
VIFQNDFFFGGAAAALSVGFRSRRFTKMKKTVLLAAMILLPMISQAQVIRVELGSDYESYSNEELRRRVWTLERAVAQLQDQVFQLATRKDADVVPRVEWTCRIQSFGKTFVSNGLTRAAATAEVLKKCSDATNAIHCSDNDVKCGN